MMEPMFRTLRGQKLQGATVPMHRHDEAQLVFASYGGMQVHTDKGRWLVPPQLAVWLPAGILHRIDVLSDTEHWMIYWHASAPRLWAPSESLERPFALRVTPLLRELIFAAFEANATAEKAELVVQLVLHELTETPDAPTFLPLPTSAAGRRAADLVLADGRSEIGLDKLASRAGTSVRTLSRLYPAETGLTFKAWRQRARIVVTMDRLAAGTPVSQVAVDAGFSSTAAFSFAFRQVTSMTPTAFLDHRHPARGDGVAGRARKACASSQ